MFLKKLLKQNLVFLGLGTILLLAVFLRFYRLPELMVFIGDQGRDYLAARDMLLNHRWPLVGIPSSVPWLKQGPVFIWLLALALKLGNFHPLSPAILTAAFGVLAVYLLYRLSEQWFSRRVAALAAFQLAASPLAVIHSRMPYHISPIPLFAILYLAALFTNSVFWSFFLSGILLQFELTTFPLVVLAIYYFYKQKQKFFPAALIFFLPFLPKLIYDLTHGFKQTAGFIAWLSFRVVSFFNPVSQHSVNFHSVTTVLKTIFLYWQKLVVYDQPVAAALIGALVIFTLIKINSKPAKLLFSFVLINFLAFIIHGGPSEAYFPVLLPAFALLIALALDRLKPLILYSSLFVLTIYNSYYLVQNNFIPYGPTLSQRILVTKFIIANSQNQPFKLKNYYSVSQFPSYLDNYRYLLWWLGKAEDPTALQTYMIYEGSDSSFSVPLNSTIYHFSKIKLIKL